MFSLIWKLSPYRETSAVITLQNIKKKTHTKNNFLCEK